MSENTSNISLVQRLQSDAVKFSERYKDSPVRILVELVGSLPGFGIAKTAMEQRIEQFNREKARVLFDRLAKGDLAFDAPEAMSDDTLHAVLSTLRAASRSRTNARIRTLADLLIALMNGTSGLRFDEFEEFVRIAEELSERELAALVILRSYEAQAPAGDRWTVAKSYWLQFEKRLSDELGINTEMVQDFLQRLARTGLYHHTSVSYNRDDMPEAEFRAVVSGWTTDTFRRFTEVLPQLEYDTDAKKHPA